MAETPAALMRRCAEQLRQAAAAMRTELDENDYWRSDGRSHDERYALGVEEALGGTAGTYAARFTPGRLDLMAASWDAIAAEMDDYPAVHVPGGIGIALYPDIPSEVWTAAYRAVEAYLKADGGDRG